MTIAGFTRKVLEDIKVYLFCANGTNIKRDHRPDLVFGSRQDGQLESGSRETPMRSRYHSTVFTRMIGLIIYISFGFSRSTTLYRKLIILETSLILKSIAEEETRVMDTNLYMSRNKADRAISAELGKRPMSDCSWT